MNSDGRTVLVTGVGRRRGIGYAITRRLLQDERARVFAQSCDAYDVSEPWGAGTPGAVQVLAELSTAPGRLGHLDIDLSDPEAPAALFDAAESRFGAVDSLVINHARSQLGDVGSLAAEPRPDVGGERARVLASGAGICGTVRRSPRRRTRRALHVRAGRGADADREHVQSAQCHDTPLIEVSLIIGSAPPSG